MKEEIKEMLDKVGDKDILEIIYLYLKQKTKK
ncbi:hypothetical protein phiCD38-2_gp38 [Clostridium phage phiCD38-2]|uniref:Uncharacterized protein n=1 Tax=Clostridium phage phiCD38-2 TaxID=1032362 RepID=F6K8N7_9CAUD|nr:hypothetical protein phiCD38-2_gp38 [Clostridium phage phiCD38-2]AEF56913.1 hypothetical protein phiCD38-2_gp38 [Clostridium phage phiCD38-2]PCD11062.1 hypothetical protein V440_18165 [Clostridioides difficile]